MRLKLGPSSQRGRERESKGGHGGKDRDFESVCVCICSHLSAHIHEFERFRCVFLYAIENSLCRHLHRFWHIHRGAACDMKSASSSASSCAPLWIQKSVLWHGPFTSSSACSTIYLCALWSRAVGAGFGFLAASGYLPATARESFSLPSYDWVVEATRHSALGMCGEWGSIVICWSVFTNHRVEKNCSWKVQAVTSLYRIEKKTNPCVS